MKKKFNRTPVSGCYWDDDPDCDLIQSSGNEPQRYVKRDTGTKGIPKIVLFRDKFVVLFCREIEARTPKEINL